MHKVIAGKNKVAELTSYTGKFVMNAVELKSYLRIRNSVLVK